MGGVVGVVGVGSSVVRDAGQLTRAWPEPAAADIPLSPPPACKPLSP